MAEGLPAHGGGGARRSPADGLQPLARRAPAGARAGAVASTRTASSPRSSRGWNLAGWPFGYVYWPLERALGTVLAWNAFVLLGFLGAGGLTALWLARARVTSRSGARAAASRSRSLRTSKRSGAPGHLLAWSAMLLPLSLYALERARRGSQLVARSLRRSARLDPALGPAPPLARGDPVLLRLRARPAPLGGAPRRACDRGRASIAYVLAVRDTTGASGRQFRQVERYSARCLRLLLAEHGRPRAGRVPRLDRRRPRGRRARDPRRPPPTRPRRSSSAWALSFRSSSRSGRTCPGTRRSGAISRGFITPACPSG